MRVRHPNAVRETVDDVDDAVTVAGDTYAVADDGTAELPERAARAWADRYDLDVAAIAVGDEPDENPTGDDVCGYYDEDAMDSPCARDAGWGRDADTGHCKDHHEED